MGTKFNVNRQPVPDEEINSHKDFGELVKKFKQQSIQKARNDTNFLKNKKATYSAVIAGVAVICTVTYFSVFKKQPLKETSHDKIVTTQKNTSSNSSLKTGKAFITPPIAKLNVPYSSYHVKAEHGGTITHPSKSKIIIPKKAFVNKQGQDIIGDVQIQYREFHNQADIIASGIPMTYDSAGIQSHLESAGMFDIKGYQNGEPVFINPEKPITVEFASTQPADRYNMYTLDTVARNWVYVCRDNSLKNKKTEPAQQLATNPPSLTDHPPENEKTKALQIQIDAIPPKIEHEKIIFTKNVNSLAKATLPTKPTKVTPGRQQFALELNYKEFPELEPFKNAVFELGPENKNYTPELTDITWSSAEVSEGPIKGKNYLLTLKLRQRTEKLVVYPALTGTDYDKALKLYDSKFTEYKTLLAKREADEKALKEAFEAKQAEYLAEQKKLTAEQLKEQVRLRQQQEQEFEEQFKTMGTKQLVMRVFQVSSFGICNSDCPTSMPQGESVNPVFVLNHGESFVTPTSTYLVSHSKNVVYNFDAGLPLSYNPKESYSLCILAKGKLYLCDKETFASVSASKQTKIPVHELGEGISNTFDLKKAMGLN